MRVEAKVSSPCYRLFAENNPLFLSLLSIGIHCEWRERLELPSFLPSLPISSARLESIPSAAAISSPLCLSLPSEHSAKLSIHKLNLDRQTNGAEQLALPSFGSSCRSWKTRALGGPRPATNKSAVVLRARERKYNKAGLILMNSLVVATTVSTMYTVNAQLQSISCREVYKSYDTKIAFS